MLVLSRRNGEEIYITLKDGSEIRIAVVGMKAGQVRLGFEAHPDVVIMRAELVTREAR